MLNVVKRNHIKKNAEVETAVFQLFTEENCEYRRSKEVYIPDGIPYRIDNTITYGPVVAVNLVDADEILCVEYKAYKNGDCEYEIKTGMDEVLALSEYGTVAEYEALIKKYAEDYDRYNADTV